jgi:hypothetical protein
MATEDQARRARNIHQNRLMEGGAHALSIEPLKSLPKAGAKSYGIVAWVDEKPEKGLPPVPQWLEIEEKDRKVKVPVAVRKAKPFQLE